MDDSNVTSIADARKDARRRRGDQVVPPERRSQATKHLPADATRAEARRAGKVTRAKRRSDVLTLAVAGHTVEKIAEVLTEKYKGEGLAGITGRSVEITINHALEEWKARDAGNVEQVRAMQLTRLDAMLAAISTDALKGNLKAVDRVLRLEALRAKIAGTEAPRRLEVSGSIALGVEEAEIERGEQAWLEAGGDVIDVEVLEEADVAPDAP